jgi:DNA-binding transcriptional LysR family regulator
MGDGDPALVRLATGLTPPTRAIWLATYPDLKRAPGIRAALAFLAAAIGQGCPSGPS